MLLFVLCLLLAWQCTRHFDYPEHSPGGMPKPEYSASQWQGCEKAAVST